MKAKAKSTKFQKKRIAFVTFNILGYRFLEELLDSGVFEIVRVYTLDKKYISGKSDYKDIAPLCQEHQLDVKYIKNINEEASDIKKLDLDYLFVNGWSQIVGKEILSIPRFGCIGSHPALLPHNRGRAAVPWHFILEEKYGGMSIFFLSDGCDDGLLIGQRKFSLTPKDNAGTFYEKMVTAGCKILRQFARDIKQGTVKTKKQDESKATYLLIRKEADSFLDFNQLTDKQVFNQVRAVAPIYPLAFAFYKEEKIKFGAAKMLPKAQQNYFGTPGQIAQVFEDKLWVMTQKGMIELQYITNEQEEPIQDGRKIFRVGSHFNRND